MSGTASGTVRVHLLERVDVLLGPHENQRQAVRDRCARVGRGVPLLELGTEERDAHVGALHENPRPQRVHARAHEVAVHRPGLLAEDVLTDGVEKDFMLPEKPMTNIFDSSLSRLGLLPGEECEKVISTYLLVKSVPEKLALLANPSPIEGLFYIGKDHIDAVAKMHRNLLPTIDETVVSLNPQGASSFAGVRARTA